MASLKLSKPLSLTSAFTLSSGHSIPALGLGFFETPNGAPALESFKVGYRHIDSARYYQNEGEMGVAVRQSGIPREQIFCTSKVLSEDYAFSPSISEAVVKAVESSLSKFGCDYFDLYLLHDPGAGPKGRIEAWKGLEVAVEKGYVKSIGVSNFCVEHLEELLASNLKIRPAVNQVELHPWYQQRDVKEFCDKISIFQLERTDMPQYALEALRKAQVKKIEIVGRRGPLQMACTTKEVRELMNIPRTAFFLDEVDKGHLKTASAELAENGDSVQNGRMMKRIFDLLQKGSKVSPEDSSKSWTFKFLKAPLGLVEEDGGKMKAVQWGSNQLLHDRHNSKASKVTAIPGVVETRKADVLFKSIGYRSVGIDGLPMDEKTSTYKNENGRILDQAGRRVPGLYAAGWLARGPTGVIADTLSYAYDSADSLILDSRSCRNPHRTEDASLENYRKKLEKDGAVIWKGWQAIDAEERRRGGRIGKERVKITDVHEALKVARTT
ncbi:Aldo/keto reductase [Atractiella rhizophila]|nr:Aldo/keto reductase [Atractiella rhizophila]